MEMAAATMEIIDPHAYGEYCNNNERHATMMTPTKMTSLTATATMGAKTATVIKPRMRTLKMMMLMMMMMTTTVP